MLDMGLNSICLEQSTTTLSGDEAQRVKLAACEASFTGRYLRRYLT